MFRLLYQLYHFHHSQITLGINPAKLGHVGAQGIARLCDLLDQHIPRAMQNLNSLLILRFYSTNRIAGPSDSLADRSRIGPVILLPPHIRLHVSRRNEFYIMSEFPDFLRPIMGRGTGFHTHKTGLLFAKPIQNF